MLPLLLAQAEATPNWTFVVAISGLLGLGVNFFAVVRLANGKANERQIEPTQIAALQEQMRRNHEALTGTLQKLDRESEGTRVSIENVKDELTRLRDEVKREDENQFKRINSISGQAMKLEGRVDSLERERARKS